MRSKKLLALAGLLFAVVVAAAVAVELRHYAVATGLLGVLMAGNVIVALTSIRRLQLGFQSLEAKSDGLASLHERQLKVLARRHERVLKLLRKLRSGREEPVPATLDDVVGSMRLMQSQYVGRLDRAQSTMEDAAALLRHLVSTSESELARVDKVNRDSLLARLGEVIVAAPPGSSLELNRLDARIVPLARLALSEGLKVHCAVNSGDLVLAQRVAAKAGLESQLTLVDLPGGGDNRLRVSLLMPVPTLAERHD